MTVVDNISAAARALRVARATLQPIAPISATYGIATLEDAYAVAAINTRERIRGTVRVVGQKVGLTSIAVQRQLGVDQPDFGVLFSDMEFQSGSEVPSSRLLQPKVEAEIAFVIGRDLDIATPSWSEFAACIAYCLPALEIVDSAITDWKISLADTVADNASCGLYVLGDQPVSLGRLQLQEVQMELQCNGTVVSIGAGTACMGHPLRAAFWLARTLGARGQRLRSGQVILSGALGPMVPLQVGDAIDAHLGSMGSVSCRLV